MDLILWFSESNLKLFHGGGPYHIETSPLIYRSDRWTGFYMIGSSVMKDLTVKT